MANILIMAGGTGGHIIPAMSVAKRLRDQGHEIHWLGTKLGLEADLVPKADIPLHCIKVKGVRKKGLKAKFKLPFELLSAMFQAMKVIERVKPQMVVGFGGYASGPGGLAAKLKSVPLFIHEQNAKAGMTNRWLAKVASQSFQAFPNAIEGAKTIGNPVRNEFFAIKDASERIQENQPLKVLVVGGSLGAVDLNQAVLGALKQMPKESRPALKHQVGKRNEQAMLDAYKSAEVEAEVVSFIDDMAQAFEWADMLICRAGALTVSEVAAAGVAALFVPYPYAVDDHQTLNAQFLTKQKAGLLKQQKELDGAWLAKQFEHFSQNKSELIAMGGKARELASRDACEQLVIAVNEKINNKEST